TLPPSVLPDISPARGEIGRHRWFRQSPTSEISEAKAAVQSPPSRGRCPAGQRGALSRKRNQIWLLFAALFFAFAPHPASAANVDDLFRAWLASDLWPEAKSHGISKATFDAAFAGVKPNLKLPDLVMPGEKPKTPQKQHQAEFGTPGDYFAEKKITAVTSAGR